MKEMGEDTITKLLGKVSHLYFRNSFEQLSGLGIHPGQLPLIKVLGDSGELSQRELAERLHIKPSTVAVSIRRLEHAGILERNSDLLDQRVKRIRLTDRGKVLNQQIRDIIKHNEKVLFRGFTESEKCLMNRFLMQIIRNLEESQSC